VIARDIQMEGENRMRTGNGGGGGDVRDVAPSYADRSARAAYARGGRGGNAGSVALLAERRTSTPSTIFWLELGVGSRGGSADAIGAAGSTSKGDGRGGEGGPGGTATCRPGRGADGTSISRDGAHSGAAMVHGGPGGRGGVLFLPGDTDSIPVGAGGDAGRAIVVGGGGGDGFGLCDDGVNAGGRGGNGGRVEIHECVLRFCSPAIARASVVFPTCRGPRIATTGFDRSRLRSSASARDRSTTAEAYLAISAATAEISR